MKSSFTMTAVGVIRTPHTDPARTPIQPVFARGIPGRVELYEEFADGLDDIETFSHVYLLYVFDRSGEPSLRVRPFLEDTERGLFATRSPRRPNPIGMSLVRVVGRDGPVLHVEDVDILDGTPLLDVKPYSRRFDERPEASCGWQDDLDDDEVLRRGRRDYGSPSGESGK